MHTWRNYIGNNRSISWLLVIALVCMVMFPVTFHLHHIDKIAGQNTVLHTHVVEQHNLVGFESHSHHDLDAETGVQTVFSTSDIPALKANTLFTPVLALIIYLFFVFFKSAISITFSQYRNSGFTHRENHFSPPLRAPPFF